MGMIRAASIALWTFPIDVMQKWNHNLNNWFAHNWLETFVYLILNQLFQWHFAANIFISFIDYTLSA